MRKTEKTVKTENTGNTKRAFKLLSLALALMMTLLLFGCGEDAENSASGAASNADSSASTVEIENVQMKIATLAGPTGMGMAKLMEDTKTDENYSFTVETAPEALSAAVIKGTYDIAALPVNLASVLYKKTGGAVQIAAVNTLGTLYIVENGSEIKSVADLKGKTILSAGQGSTPEYVLRYILAKNGLDPDKDVTVEYKSEHAEVATLLATKKAQVGLLPEPNATAVKLKNKELRTALDLNEIWNSTAPEGNKLTQGCIVVKRQFAQEHKIQLDKFLESYNASVKFVNENAQQAAALIVSHKILGIPEAAVKQAIPSSNICYIDSDEMETAVTAYLQVLYDANPASVGGAMPDENFYYRK